MRNHGTRHLRGLNPDAFTTSNDPQSRSISGPTTGRGRFQRLFPETSFTISDPDPAFTAVGAPAGPMDSGASTASTTNVPLGLIYLGQFIDHDITLDITSSLDRMNDPDATENFRTPALDLDCVYGDGPEANPHLYDRDGEYLATGADGTAFVHQSVAYKGHDLCRNPHGTAIIGDPRNDENRVISQLQLAFLRFHNAVMKKIKDNDPHVTGLALAALDEHVDEPFLFAQRLVRWHYQWIINNEFLPTLCGQGLIDQILAVDPNDPDRGRKIYDPTDAIDRAFIPIEFAVAAYRFGHSMIAQTVKTAEDDSEPLFGQKLGRGFEPLSSRAGIMIWPFLFDINGSNFQRADKLDVKLASLLLNLPFTSPSSLAFRNLKRGFSFGLASGEEVHTAIASQLTSPLSNVHGNRIRDLSGGHFGTGSDFAGFTPLWFYILAEADDFNDGQFLGPVGGRLVAETMIGIQQKDSTSYLSYNAANGTNWTPNLLPGSSNFTMADLLTYS